jgi:hypothetical protein
MLPNRQKIYDIASTRLMGREFSRRELLTLIDQHYPGTNHDSILPSDYLLRDAIKSDPSTTGTGATTCSTLGFSNVSAATAIGLWVGMDEIPAA